MEKVFSAGIMREMDLFCYCDEKESDGSDLIQYEKRLLIFNSHRVREFVSNDEYSALLSYLDVFFQNFEIRESESDLFIKCKEVEFFLAKMKGDAKEQLKVMLDIQKKYGNEDSQAFNEIVTFRNSEKEFKKRKKELEKLVEKIIPLMPVGTPQVENLRIPVARAVREKLEEIRFSEHGFVDTVEPPPSQDDFSHACSICGEIDDIAMIECLTCGSRIHNHCLPSGFFSVTEKICPTCNPKKKKSRKKMNSDVDSSNGSRKAVFQKRSDNTDVPKPPAPKTVYSKRKKKKEVNLLVRKTQPEKKIVRGPPPPVPMKKRTNATTENNNSATNDRGQKSRKRKRPSVDEQLLKPTSAILTSAELDDVADPVLPQAKRRKRDGPKPAVPRVYFESASIRNLFDPSLGGKRDRIVHLLDLDIPDFVCATLTEQIVGVSLTRPRDDNHYKPIRWRNTIIPPHLRKSGLEKGLFTRAASIGGQKYLITFLADPNVKERKFNEGAGVSREIIFFRRYEESKVLEECGHSFFEDISYRFNTARLSSEAGACCMKRGRWRFQTFIFLPIPTSDNVTVSCFVKRNGMLSFNKFSFERLQANIKKLKIKNVVYKSEGLGGKVSGSDILDIKAYSSGTEIKFVYMNCVGDVKVNHIKPSKDKWEEITMTEIASITMRVSPNVQTHRGIISRVQYTNDPKEKEMVFVTNFDSNIFFINSEKDDDWSEEMKKKHNKELQSFGRGVHETEQNLQMDIIDIFSGDPGYCQVVGMKQMGVIKNEYVTQNVFISHVQSKFSVQEPKRIRVIGNNERIECCGVVKSETGGVRKKIFAKGDGGILFW